MRFDPAKVRDNVKAASTEDLLDRATVWRDGLEPAALELIETELQNRGVTPAELEAHARRRAENVIATPDGVAAVCYRCAKPAVERRWVWGKFRGVPSLFPQRLYVCEEHRSGKATPSP
jgi:hypothetical protein